MTKPKKRKPIGYRAPIGEDPLIAMLVRVYLLHSACSGVDPALTVLALRRAAILIESHARNGGHARVSKFDEPRRKHEHVDA